MCGHQHMAIAWFRTNHGFQLVTSLCLLQAISTVCRVRLNLSVCSASKRLQLALNDFTKLLKSGLARAGCARNRHRAICASPKGRQQICALAPYHFMICSVVSNLSLISLLLLKFCCYCHYCYYSSCGLIPNYPKSPWSYTVYTWALK